MLILRWGEDVRNREDDVHVEGRGCPTSAYLFEEHAQLCN